PSGGLAEGGNSEWATDVLQPAIVVGRCERCGGFVSNFDLAVRFQSVREFTEQLAAPLSPEDQTVQSMPDASPTKWHLAHTTWFFETFVLRAHAPGYRVFDPASEYLFNSSYEA